MAPSKKAAAAKKAVPGKKSAPAKKAVPGKKSAPAKKAAPGKKVARKKPAPADIELLEQIAAGEKFTIAGRRGTGQFMGNVISDNLEDFRLGKVEERVVIRSTIAGTLMLNGNLYGDARIDGSDLVLYAVEDGFKWLTMIPATELALVPPPPDPEQEPAPEQ